MLGKGVKRKLEDEEQEEAERDRPGAVGTGSPTGGSLRGVHGPAYSLQRQTVFNLSLLKLCSPTPLTDPSLQRRVLISNTLRLLQEELRREGAMLAPPSDPAQPGLVSPIAREEVRTREVSMMTGSGLGGTTAPPSALEWSLTPACVLEEHGQALLSLPNSWSSNSPPSSSSSSSSSASPQPASIPNDSFSSALDEIEELSATTGPTSYPSSTSIPSSSVSFSSLSTSSISSIPPISSSPSGMSVDEGMESPNSESERSDTQSLLFPNSSVAHSNADSVPLLSPYPFPSSPTPSLLNPTPFPSDSSLFPSLLTDLALDDFLFSDIDAFMCDFNPCGSPLGSGAMVSKVTDDLVKTLSGYSNSSGPVSLSQNQKLDLNELEHIMEVLVGS